MKSKLPTFLALFVLVVLGLVAKIHYEGSLALNAADSFMEEAKPEKARRSYLHAGKWHLPFTSTTALACSGLTKIADAHIENEAWMDAVTALDDIRAVHYSTSWVLSSGSCNLDETNGKMALALARWKLSENQGSEEELKTRYLKRLTEHPSPNRWYSILMGLALIAWFGSLARVAWSIDKPRKTLPWLLAAIVFFGLWVYFLGLI
mgnify:CR=1 FL=1